MRILFVGDVVGRAGRTAIAEYLPGMVRDWSLDLVIVNGENSAGGFGITEEIYLRLREAGADVITLGNHTYRHREVYGYLDSGKPIIRCANQHHSNPGKGWVVVEKGVLRLGVINLIGQHGLDIVVVDYLQLMSGSSSDGAIENPQESLLNRPDSSPLAVPACAVSEMRGKKAARAAPMLALAAISCCSA